MSGQLREMCVLFPEYNLLVELVRVGQFQQVRLSSREAFSVNMLAVKELVEVRDGYVFPTAVGRAATRARKAEVGTSFFFTPSDLAAAIALGDRLPSDS